MAHTIKIGSFAKHENSTAQPTVTGWAEFEITLKDGAELSNPVITLAADITDILSYNYAYLFGRYYWIREKTMERSGFCRLRLEVDVLATYKSQIGATYLYILRSSAASDGNIVDRYYAQTASKTVTPATFENFPSVGFSGGYYVVNVAGKGNNGTSTLYSFTPQQFSDLVGQLLGTVDSAQPVTGDWLGLIEAVHNTLFEPIKYINSVMWFPFQFTGNDYTVGTTFYIGKWACGIAHRIITNPVGTIHNEAIALPKHPKAATRGNYLNLAPYSQYSIEYDPFGSFSIDTSQLVDVTNIRATLYADALTGQGTLKIRGDQPTACLASITTQVGVQLPITQAGLGSGTLSSAVNVIGGIGAFAATGGAASLLGAAAAGIDTAAGSITGSVSSIGSQGGVLAYQIPKGITATFYDVVNEDNTRNGRPLCQVTTPATLGGFMIAQKGDVEIAAPIQEVEEISRLLESGFYYE